MAVVVPKDLGRDSLRVARAELDLLETFAARLPDDYTLYQHERLTGKPPALILIGPALGMVPLDVRGWSSTAISRVTRFEIEIRESGATTKTSLEELRFCVLPIERALARQAGAADAAWCPVTPAVVLPNLGRDELDVPRVGGATLRQALSGHGVLTRQDLEGDLFARLRALVPSPDLTPEQLDAARATLFPELRVTWAGRPVVLDARQDEIVHLPDLGHHVVDAPAGTGKTVMLIARTRYLRQRHPDWRIMVVTFNRVTADVLRAELQPDSRLDVLHFHSWCWRALERGGLEIPALPTFSERTTYWRDTIPRLLMQGFSDNRLGATRYDAILVDDGHDFMPSWYPALVQALDPATASLFVVGDRNQVSHTIDWRRCGVKADPVVAGLVADYRSPDVIARAARRLADPSAPEDAPTPAGNHGLRGGFAPDVRVFPSREAERKQVLAWLRQRLAGKTAPESVLILGLLRPDMAELETWLEDAGIIARLTSGRSIPGAVRLSTVHGAKGLEADFVLLLHAHQLDQLRPDDARQLLYVAMTRARVQLAVYSHAPSALLDQLDAILNPRTVMPWAHPSRRPGPPVATSS